MYVTVIYASNSQYSAPPDLQPDGVNSLRPSGNAIEHKRVLQVRTGFAGQGGGVEGYDALAAALPRIGAMKRR